MPIAAPSSAEQRWGDYLVGYAIEEAEGMYWLEDGLVWKEPEDENVHIEIAVRDASDGRFIPGLDVRVTLLDEEGHELGTESHDLVWHPMLYHYARNWKVPEAGSYRMRVEFDAPRFGRHDEVNGRRYAEPGRVEFEGIRIHPAS